MIVCAIPAFFANDKKTVRDLTIADGLDASEARQWS
jgi:hypothetical protein